MNKKILKRSLALGALMAFVITGSAWAGSITTTTDGRTIYSEFNNPTGHGGAINQTSERTFDKYDFVGNSTSNNKKGGAMNCSTGGNLVTIIDSTFCQNNSAEKGGAISINASKVTIDGSEELRSFKDTNGNEYFVKGNFFKDNKTQWGSWGGAINVEGNDDATVLTLKGYNTFEGNESYGGGAIGSHVKYALDVGGVATFKDNKATGNYGGGAIYNKNGTLNFVGDKLVFDKNKSYLSGGAIYNESGTLVFKTNGTVGEDEYDIKFLNNTAGDSTKNYSASSTRGGAIYNGSSGIITFESCKALFEGNKVDDCYSISGSLKVEGHANDIYNAGTINVAQGATVTLLSGINGNGTTNIKGGTLNGKLTSYKSGSSTYANKVTISDGGTWNLQGDSVVHSIVVNGDATINGAKADGSKSSLTLDRELTKIDEHAINHTSGVLTINNVILENINKDNGEDGNGSQGSVIYSRGNGTVLNLLNGIVQNNTNDGELKKRNAVIRVDGDMTVDNVKFLNNKALGVDGDTTAMGGAFYISTAGAKISEDTITNSTFTGNESAEGGAVFVNKAIVNFENSDFNENHARVNGGALNVQYTGAVVSLDGEYDFKGNTAGKNGGAIAVYGNHSEGKYGLLTIDGKANFTGNEATGQGGAIHNEGIMNVNGIATFTDNIANGIANDIYNAGIININQGAIVNLDGGITGSGTTNINGGNLELAGNNRIGILKVSDGGKIAFGEKGHLDVDEIDESSDIVTITMVGKDADDLNTKEQLTTVAERMGVAENYKATDKVKVVMTAGEIVGETTGDVVFETKVNEDGVDYYHGVVKNKIEQSNPANEAISDTAIGMKLHWRAHVNDMNKRMGELRDANGEHGVWTRMVRGESEYKNTKAQYNQYQLGYDEKLSVDKRWTVGAAVTFSEGDASYGYGSTEDKSTAFAIYGSKLNNDGTFVDLIARYAHLESDVDDQAGTGSYSANGMSVSAEVGKRIQQGNGLWIEPQAELTYGTIDSAEYKLGTKTVEVGDMDSLIGRIGFRIGKDIEKGNVYARASYLYDFEGETENAFRNDTARRSFNEDLGGGWWEVGVGANINLSKATYVYADIEKTFGGEVDTNWQWNLGVRYSF